MRAILLVLLCWTALPSIAVAASRPYHATRERRINFTDQPPKIRASMRRARAVIYRVILPDISVHAVSFNDAIEVIRQGFRERHPEHLGLSIFFKRPVGRHRPVGEPAPPSEPVSLVSLALRSTRPPLRRSTPFVPKAITSGTWTCTLWPSCRQGNRPPSNTVPARLSAIRPNCALQRIEAGGRFSL